MPYLLDASSRQINTGVANRLIFRPEPRHGGPAASYNVEEEPSTRSVSFIVERWRGRLPYGLIERTHGSDVGRERLVLSKSLAQWPPEASSEAVYHL